jgi:heptosyltransferase-2
VADVRRHFAQARLTIAARGSVAPLFALVEGVDDVLRLPGRGGLGVLTDWKADAAALASAGFDTAVLLPNSFATALSAARARIKERWGFATDWRSRLLTRAVPKARGPLHQAAYYQALVAGLGIQPGPRLGRVQVELGGRDARQLVRDAGLDPDAAFVVFAPGAAYGRAKQWLPERFAELSNLVQRERGWTVVLVGTGADADVCREIAREAPAVVNLAGRTDLSTLAAVLSRSRGVVSNDSGSMHLAGALGVRVVAVFGATSEGRTSPLTAGPDSPVPAVVTYAVFCRPCMLRECPIDHRCMRGVTARRVFDALTNGESRTAKSE